MSKFGNKFTCWKCATKFYDLNKPNPKCPKCASSPEDDPNKGMPVLPPPATDFGDDEEDVPEPVEDEEAEDEAVDDEPPDTADDY